MPDDVRLSSLQLFQEKLAKFLDLNTRYSVLDFETTGNFLIIRTDTVQNAIHISEYYQKSSPSFKIKVVLLPDKSIVTLTKGICHVGVAPVRQHAASKSEQVTQILFGESFDTLQIDREWIRVRLHEDGYIGWVSANQATLLDDKKFQDFRALPILYAADDVVEIRERASGGADAIREAVYGARLRIRDGSGSFVQVLLPDGTKGWAQKSKLRSSVNVANPSVKTLIKTAHRFLGISYVWGGRSAKGFDCSGFVQTVFKLNGIDLPRDADMQFLTGNKVGKDLRKLKAGDLLFFSSNGDKITHVAIYSEKNREFVHSSGFVRVNSFDPSRKNYSKKLLSTFVGACRVI